MGGHLRARSPLVVEGVQEEGLKPLERNPGRPGVSSLPTGNGAGVAPYPAGQFHLREAQRLPARL